MNSLQSAVHILSRFTTEALFFESLAILTLLAGYTAFWVNKKRKFGVIKQDVPAPLVKTYLNELILDAENLRIQLFGLLSRGQVATGGQVMLGDPNATARIASLEGKIAEQTRAMDGFLAEKTRIEQELMSAKQASGGTESAESAVAVAQLKDKVQSLEGRLAEYSVIEDDLANLKRLQQENQQLKAQLGQGATSAGPAVAVAVAAPVAAKAAPVATPVAAAPAAVATEDAMFEGLVDSVEKSLEKPAAVAVATATPPSTTTDAPSDADLVAEFEKMLNG